MRLTTSRPGWALAALYALAFAGAYALYVRADGAWPDAEYLYLVALPYTLAMLRLAGGSVDFSPDSPVTLLKAALFGAALGYIGGALVGAAVGWAWRSVRRG